MTSLATIQFMLFVNKVAQQLFGRDYLALKDDSEKNDVRAVVWAAHFSDGEAN